MPDTWLLAALGGLFLVFVLIDVYVARRLWLSAAIRPPLEALNAAAIIAVAITVDAGIGCLLGINGIVRNITGATMIPSPLTLVLLAIALGVPSVANVYLLRLLKRWDGDRRNAHIHARDHEAPRYHRRKDDTPPTA